ncbi:mas-related G-protein coupled receptor member A8-like [Mugil cephalus]|uniref:mas-related G-protein coupled receptor member A8-like n=1 Tax=Mugil cephalus TaxID=48193 RepID=UPI001FB6EC29|nr:mas-related G-protein coupled receptor member A8-like [Mugil cephalus]
MAHFNISTTWNESYEEKNNSKSNSYKYDNDFISNFLFCEANACYFGKRAFIVYVFALVIICISLPLILLAIYSLSSLVRKDHGAPLYIINLLISDLVQLLCMIGRVAIMNSNTDMLFTFIRIYNYGLLSSVGFMVCISLERYLLIVWPLWYRFRRTIKTSVVVCVLVWILPLVYVLPYYFRIDNLIAKIIFVLYLLLPLPLFIFFLGGTLKALSASISVSSDEKRRIVAVLVVVLLIYILLFLPYVFWLVPLPITGFELWTASNILVQLSPLADLILYFFMRKGTTDKILASLCCCRMQLQEINSIDDSNFSFLKQINGISDQ